MLVLVGATLLPLSLEVLWRSDGGGYQNVQPEVSVVETAGQRAAQERADALGSKEQAGPERVRSAHFLPVEGQQHHAAVECRSGQERQGGCGRERPVREQPDVDQRVAGATS